MIDPSIPIPDSSGFLRSSLSSFRQETGLSPAHWIILALVAFLTQIVLHRELAPGEFGTLNTALGVIGLMTIPLAAFSQGLAWYLAQNHPEARTGPILAMREATVPVMETFAWIWATLSLPVLLLLVLPWLGLPRFSLDLFILLNVFVGLAGLTGRVISENSHRLGYWTSLLVASVIARLFAGGTLAAFAPWAEAGLAAFLATGCITLVPVLRHPMVDTMTRLKALRAIADRDLLIYLAATLSVLLAVFLFTSADRIIAQSWFGSPNRNYMGFYRSYVDWPAFDAYQTAALLARSLLWGTQPILLLWFARRSPLTHTTASSLTWFWIYLGTLISGAAILILLRDPLCQLFCGKDFAPTAALVPALALAMMPLGLLQALGIFALASRRYPECFALGGSSLMYALVLYLFGEQPRIMPAYMFGLGMVAVMVVLFVGVVRWGRKQP